jgi:hypothetical protein
MINVIHLEETPDSVEALAEPSAAEVHFANDLKNVGAYWAQAALAGRSSVCAGVLEILANAGPKIDSGSWVAQHGYDLVADLERLLRFDAEVTKARSIGEVFEAFTPMSGLSTLGEIRLVFGFKELSAQHDSRKTYVSPHFPGLRLVDASFSEDETIITDRPYIAIVPEDAGLKVRKIE